MVEGLRTRVKSKAMTSPMVSLPSGPSCSIASRPLRPAHDVSDMANCLFDHRGRYVEVGAGADAPVHHRKQHAPLAKCGDHLVRWNARAIWPEEHQICLGLLHLDACDLRQPARKCARISMIVSKAIDVMVECEDAGCGADPGLPHRSTKPLLKAPDLVDEGR